MINPNIQSRYKTKIFETSTHQRAGDGKIELLGKIAAPELNYHYKNENGNDAVIHASRWVAIDVLDSMADLLNKYNSSIKAKEA